jgi:hypothetical protein
MTRNERADSPNPTDAHQEKKMGMKSKLSTLWIFAALNYLYCDVVGLMDRGLLRQFLAGEVDGIPLTQGFLLGAAILVEIPIAMVLLSRFLTYRANRWANILAGSVMTVVQFSTLFFGTSTIYYVFFSIIEIATTVLIVWFAWNWRKPVGQVELYGPQLSASHR